MDWQAWIWAAIAPITVVALVLVGRLVLQILRKQRERDDDSAWLMEMAEWILDALEKEGRRRLAGVPQAEVEAAAREVYRQYIAGTVIAKMIDEQAFILLVVERWRQIAGVGQAVNEAIKAVRAQNATAPPG